MLIIKSVERFIDVGAYLAVIQDFPVVFVAVNNANEYVFFFKDRSICDGHDASVDSECSLAMVSR